MAKDTVAESRIPDAELVLQFESLGDSCEFGLVQRMAGAEPLGMFRFAGAPVTHVTRALNARFLGIADPSQVHVQPENGQYMIKLDKYDFIYHAYVKIGGADPAALHRQHVRTVAFLIDKLVADLQEPTKIVVFRQNEDVSANALMDFRQALAAYGPSMLLWVQPTRPGFPPGSVVVVDGTLMVGYVSRLARRDNATDFDFQSWLAVLRNAHQAYSTLTLPAKANAVKPNKETPSARNAWTSRSASAATRQRGNAGGPRLVVGGNRVHLVDRRPQHADCPRPQASRYLPAGDGCRPLHRRPGRRRANDDGRHWRRIAAHF